MAGSAGPGGCAWPVTLQNLAPAPGGQRSSWTRSRAAASKQVHLRGQYVVLRGQDRRTPTCACQQLRCGPLLSGRPPAGAARVVGRAWHAHGVAGWMLRSSGAMSGSCLQARLLRPATPCWGRSSSSCRGGSGSSSGAAQPATRSSSDCSSAGRAWRISRKSPAISPQSYQPPAACSAHPSVITITHNRSESTHLRPRWRWSRSPAEQNRQQRWPAARLG